MRILIVGAGISGLAMSLALEKVGFTPVIIEKHPSLRITGAGIALPMNAVEVLFGLGLKDRLMSTAYTIRNIIYNLPTGETLSKACLSENKLDRFPFVALHRKDLLGLLADALITKINFNTTIADLKIDADTQRITTITLSNGEVTNFDLVIGADGLNSKLRSTMTKNSLKEDVGLTTWRFIANFKQNDPVYYFGKISAFMIYPISNTEVYCYAHVVNKLNINISHKDHLVHIFDEYPSLVSWIIRSVNQENIITGRLESVSPFFQIGNVAFIGDAAHACTPMLQQGAAKGLEDAITLAKMLKKFNRINESLLHYESIRRPRVEWINQNSDLPLKNMCAFMTDRAYENRNQLIRSNGPINVEKWKLLFSESYQDTVKKYLDQIDDQQRQIYKEKL